MKRFAALLFLFFFSFGCEDNDIAKGTPACVADMIKGLKKESVRNPPAKVFSYIFDSKTVYYIPAYCCDMFSTLLDENCNKICSPNGGISGGGDGKCGSDFFKNRTEEKLIWEDDRKMM